MGVPVKAVYQDVVEENQDELAEKVPEDAVHGGLEGG